MDELFYKKNAQLRYQLSKELDVYREKKEAVEKKKINPFILPLLSATITISTAIATQLSGESSLTFFWIPIGATLSFFICYGVFKFILFPLSICIANFLRKLLGGLNSDRCKAISFQDKKKYIAQFNYDIVNLVYLAYVMFIDKSIDEERIREYNKIEALFYIVRTNEKLKKVFIDHKQIQYKDDIPGYRVQTVLNLLKETLLLARNCQELADTEMQNQINSEIKSYNSIVTYINKLYDKKLLITIE